MKTKRKNGLKTFGGFAVLLACVFATLASSQGAVFADEISTETVQKNYLLNGLSTCYSDTYTLKEVNYDKFAGYSSLLTSNHSKVVTIPTFDGKVSEKISCGDAFKRLENLTGKSINKESLGSIGYKPSASSNAKNCVSYTHNQPEGQGSGGPKVWTNELCFEMESDGVTVKSVMFPEEPREDLEIKSNIHLQPNGDFVEISDGNNIDVNFKAAGVAWEKVSGWLEEQVNTINGNSPAISNNKYSNAKIQIDPKTGEEAGTIYEKDSNPVAAAKTYFGGSSQSGTIENRDKYAIYEEAFAKLAKVGTVTIQSSQCTPMKDSALKESKDKLVVKVGNKWCPVKVDNPNGVKGDNFPVIDADGNITTGTFQQMMDGMTEVSNNIHQDETIKINGGNVETNVKGPGDPPDSTDPPDDSGVPECTNVSGVLSWVFCPVLRFAGEAVSQVYSWLEDSFLAIKSSFMDTSSGTYAGWSAFRNIANILFAILFLVVIFAQITGIGISNYNVKKMLPRLIIVVVLVNISFILCQLAVDISNIAGSQLNSGLSGLGKDLPQFDLAKIGDVTNALVDQSASASSNVGALLGLTAATGLAAVTWKLWLLPFFLAIISAVIGVMFFFLILGVRQAGVMIAVVLAPLAIVCYALPNTKSLFDKWWKLFSALLMVYPICGALMGGGKFAGNLMIQNAGDQGFLYVIVAMLLAIMPFFAVPSILKGSLQGLGNLGAKISNFGSGIDKRATAGIKGTAGFKDAQKQLEYSRARGAERRYEFGQKVGGAIGKTRLGGALAKTGVGQSLARRSARLHAQNARKVMEGRRAQFAANNIDSVIKGEDDKEMEVMIKNADAVLRNREDINVENMDDLGKVFDETHAKLKTDPNDLSAIATMTAVQNRLASTDYGAKILHEKYNRAIANSSGQQEDQAIVAMAQRLQGAKGSALKVNAPSFAKLIQTVASNQRGDDLSRFRSDKNEDGTANEQYIRTLADDKTGESFTYANKFLNDSVAKLDEARVASMNESELELLDFAIRRGDIKGAALQNLMKVMGSALDGKGNVVLQTGQRDRINKLMRSGFAQDVAQRNRKADGSFTVTPTGSSTAMQNASSNVLNSVAASMRTVTGQDEHGNNEYEVDNDAVRNLATNAAAALNQGEYSAEEAAAYNDIISAARERGVQDANGQDFENVQASSVTYRIRGAAQEEAAPELPDGWISEEVPVYQRTARGRVRTGTQTRWRNENEGNRDLTEEEVRQANAIRQAQHEVMVENLKIRARNNPKRGRNP